MPTKQPCGDCPINNKEQQDAVIDAAIKSAYSDPTATNSLRAIAAALPAWIKADHKRVGRRMKRLTSTGALPQLKSTTGRDGRRRRTTKPVKVPPGFKPSVKLICGDALEVLKGMDADTFHCVLTSPPYFLLRDYECQGQYGLERDITSFIDNMVAVFNEVRRVLRPDGVCWINIGDTRANLTSGGDKYTPALRKARKRAAKQSTTHPKSLFMIPQRLAIALEDSGWIVRSEIIIEKNNCDSPSDRVIDTHEKLYQLVKTDKYWFDPEAIRTPYQPATLTRGATQTPRRQKSQDYDRRYELNPNGKLCGSVWKVGPANGGDHPAPFAYKLAEPCVKAGCREGGTVLDIFAGSGTTIMAAVENKRHAVGIDINQEYLDGVLQLLPSNITTHTS